MASEGLGSVEIWQILANLGSFRLTWWFRTRSRRRASKFKARNVVSGKQKGRPLQALRS